LQHRRRELNGASRSTEPGLDAPGKIPALGKRGFSFVTVQPRLLVLNPDPVFEDQSLGILSMLDGLEMYIVRTLGEAIFSLLGESFDGLIAEGVPVLVLEQATNARQHFPSLKIACISWEPLDPEQIAQAKQQDLRIIPGRHRRQLEKELKQFVSPLEKSAGTPAEGVDPCHSLIGNLNQFTAAEILQMSCLSQRSGRFTFKSSRGNSEVYLQHGAVRHAVFGSLEGEEVIAEVFRWRQGRFYFEEGIISQAHTVDRPWAHLLIANLQKFDETLELATPPNSPP
jgi:hypothetical protein